MAHDKVKIARYVLLPGIIPRFSELFRSGFHHIAYLIAVIFEMTGLLSKNHMYLWPENIGRYGVRHVLAQGYEHVDFTWRHLDRTIVFFTICSGIVLLILQVVLFLLTLMSGDVMAQAVTKSVESAYLLKPWVDWFTLDDDYMAHDMALMTLDRIFGVEGIFNSCVSTGGECLTYKGEAAAQIAAYPTSMHKALHTMFEFYSYGILFVATIIIMYFVITIVAETAQTGTPFGQRYSKAWAPIRLVLFFALLAPLSTSGTNAGLNGAQILTLYMAKYGSNMASNAWGWYGTRLSGKFLDDAENLIAKPKMPEMGAIGQFLFVAKTCQFAKAAKEVDIKAYVVTPFTITYDAKKAAAGGDTVAATLGAFKSEASSATELSSIEYKEARKQAHNGSIIIRFGEKNEDKNPTKMGYVDYECGEITLTVTDSLADAGKSTDDLQKIYFDFIKNFWTQSILDTPALCFFQKHSSIAPNFGCRGWPDPDISTKFADYFETEVRTKLSEAIDAQALNIDWALEQSGDSKTKQKGWAAAAAWYNQLASMNGAVTTSVFNFPSVSHWPRAMEDVSKEKIAADDNAAGTGSYTGSVGAGETAQYKKASDSALSAVLNKAFKAWEEEGALNENNIAASGNVILDVINIVFGTAGLLNIRENEDVHPLATLSSIGKGIMEATMRNFVVSTGLTAANLLKILGDKTSPIKQLTESLSSFLHSTALALVVIGSILYYVVPFMPFIYFFFAVSGWIKSIFEAMVAMPLWALAHLRIDGQGIPGPAATNGYFLLLEIIVRPTMILVGLIASITVFAAVVHVLNDVFDLVTANLTGFDGAEGTSAEDIAYYRSGLDQFMYTIIYAALMYMLGLSCFKLINEIPNQIMRWGGSAAATFQENAGDPAGDVNRQFYRGGTLLTSPMQGGQLALLMS